MGKIKSGKFLEAVAVAGEITPTARGVIVRMPAKAQIVGWKITREFFFRDAIRVSESIFFDSDASGYFLSLTVPKTDMIGYIIT